MSAIPKEIAELFELLEKEIVWLHGRWILYRQLYAESERRIDLLNECASAFFYVLQDVLLGDVQVSLSKLTDPAKTGSFTNLSLNQLQLRLESAGDKNLASQNKLLLASLDTMCKPFREWRNKRLAHLDLGTAMKSTKDPLPGISRQMIEDALAVVRDYMNGIERHYNNSETGYEHFFMGSKDADALVALLRYGLRYEELLRGGAISYDDWNKGKWHDA